MREVFANLLQNLFYYFNVFRGLCFRFHIQQVVRQKPKFFPGNVINWQFFNDIQVLNDIHIFIRRFSLKLLNILDTLGLKIFEESKQFPTIPHTLRHILSQFVCYLYCRFRNKQGSNEFFRFSSSSNVCLINQKKEQKL